MQIVLLILLAFILRVVVINQSFWLDEAVSVLAANKFGYTGLINEFTKYDFHPPLFYVILKFWGSIFGYGEVALRLLPILFGIGTVWVVYKIARELKINATIAGLLMATSPLHVYYSQEVRMYPLVAFFVSLAFLLFFRILKKERLIYWIVFSFSLVVFMALDYVPIFALPAFPLIAFLFKKKRGFYFRLFAASLPLFIIFVLWSPLLFGQIVSGRELANSLPVWKQIIGSPTFKELALVWVKFIVGRITFYNKFLYGLLILGVSSIFGYAFLNGIKKKSKQLAAWFFIPIILGFLFSFFVPAFSYFRFLYLLPSFYLIIASAVESRLAISILLIINIVCLGFYYGNRSNWREEWREAVAFVEASASKDDVVLFDFGEPFAPWQWYSTNRVEAFGLKGNDLNGLVKKRHGVWYFEYLADISDPQRDLPKQLSSFGFYEVNEYGFRGVGEIHHLKKI